MSLCDEMKQLADQKYKIGTAAKKFYAEKIVPEIKYLAGLGHHETVCNPWYSLGNTEGNIVADLAKQDSFKTEIFYNKGGIQQLRICW